MNNDFVGSKFPPLGDGGLISKIFKGIKTLIGKIFKQSSKEAGKTDSGDSLENIERITHIFADFNEQIYSKTIGIEKAVEK